MTSTLVETVSINYEDFNESFLTCGTCLCTYDGLEHTPKLLCCSHTVCLECLARIAAVSNPAPAPSTSTSTAEVSEGSAPSASQESNTLRCPICRELIHIPRGGVSSFPPSFLVNQLLDLMASQRREVVPKCSSHPNQELHFCETCDSVFCSLCVTSPHASIGQNEDHTVIPFSIAIKRMSEILMYKANECLAKLDDAADSINVELTRLQAFEDSGLETANGVFDEAIGVLEKKRRQIIDEIKLVAEEKRTKLKEQSTAIESERQVVQRVCSSLEYKVEVKDITKKISDLASQIDEYISMKNPKENAYILCNAKSDLPVLESTVTTSIFTSTTYPPFCVIKTKPDSLLCPGIEVELKMETMDCHSQRRQCGGDPVKVKIQCPNDKPFPSENITLTDNQDGSYTIKFTPLVVGIYLVDVEIFDRPIEERGYEVQITPHNNPLKIFEGDLCQPVAVAKGPEEIYILDTGNARVIVIDYALNRSRYIENECLKGRSCTGLAFCRTSETLLVVNWRTKKVTRLSTLKGETISSFSHPSFEEPVGISVDPCGTIYVADNGARGIFCFDSAGEYKYTIKREGFRLLGGICTPDDKTIVVADINIHIMKESGNEILTSKEIKMPGQGRFGGVAVDTDGNLIAIRTEKTKSFVQIFKNNELLSSIDSHGAKLKRPSDVLILDDRHILVVDLGNNCIKQYRYR